MRSQDRARSILSLLFLPYRFRLTTRAQEQASPDSLRRSRRQLQPKTDASTPPRTVRLPSKSRALNSTGRSSSNTDLITLTVTVTDTYGRYVSGLSKSAFTVLDEKQPQEITFFSDDDSPVSVGVIFDVSGSMSGDKIKRAREALSKFIQTSHNSDEYFLIAFNSRAQLLLDKTRDGNAVLDKLTFVQTKNNTALYDACYLGVEKVQRGLHPKRALLVDQRRPGQQFPLHFQRTATAPERVGRGVVWHRNSQRRRCRQRAGHGRPGHSR